MNGWACYDLPQLCILQKFRLRPLTGVRDVCAVQFALGCMAPAGRDVPTAAVVAGSDGDDTGEATHFRGDALFCHGDARAARLGGAITPRTTSLGRSNAGVRAACRYDELGMMR